MAYRYGYSGGYSDSELIPLRGGSNIIFFRRGKNLAYVPAHSSIPRGFQKNHDQVSDKVRVSDNPDSGLTAEDAMASLSTAWADNKAASTATLKAAIHAALQAAGFRDHNDMDLT